MIAAGYRKSTAIDLETEPPNSPDFNVLDLGMFAGLQSLWYKSSPNSIDKLIQPVSNEYNEYNPQKIENNFLTLHKCMENSLSVGSGNNYELHHMHKGKRLRIVKPITRVTCDEEFYSNAMCLSKTNFLIK